MFENQQKPEQQNLLPTGLRPFSSLPINNSLRGPTQKISHYQFSFDQKLGSGLTSDAYIGIDTQKDQLVCVKIIDREVFKNGVHKKMLDNQIKCQKLAKSQYVVEIIDVCNTNSFCFVITELCEDGDLFKLINFARIGLPQPLVAKIGSNISDALLKMKQSKIIHRDIKSSNILLKNGIAKLGDFGFAIQEKDLPEKQVSSIGSPLYMSLQCLEQNRYSYSSDIFALGVVLYQMLHGVSPWECSDQKQLIAKMKCEDIAFKSNVSNQMQKIIRNCLEMDVQKRGKIQDIAEGLKNIKISVQQKFPHKSRPQVRESAPSALL